MSAYLKQEVEALGIEVKAESFMGVEAYGSIQDCMKLNLYLRTGHRVLYLVKKFKAPGPEQLYREVKKIAWDKYIDTNGYFSVISHSENEKILDTRFANLKCKDAIADYFMDKFRKRPDSGPNRNKTVINLHWKEDDAAIYLDTSGDTIAKHGYRKIPFKAPLQETLAAAIILATRWDKTSPFINPMCGSGTLAIEAAMIASGKAPGLLRSNFGFMHIKGYQAEMWEELRKKARLSTLKELPAPIIATDISEDAITAARNNAATAGVDKFIEFKVCDFRKTPIPETPGVVVMNPEYGERLGVVPELEIIYKEIGDFFKQQCNGYTGYVFTGNLDLAKKVGLKTKRRIEFYNSQIDCRLLEYELYQGTRKISEQIST